MADHEFELRDVPWVMYFSSGYALHGAYWHDAFGRARSHGCVNLVTHRRALRLLLGRSTVPEHWHAAYTGAMFGNGTLGGIHP